MSDYFICGLILLIFFGSAHLLLSIVLIYNLIHLLIDHLQKVHATYLNVTISQFRSYVEAVNIFVAESARIHIGNGKRPPPFQPPRDSDEEEDDDVDPDFDLGGPT